MNWRKEMLKLKKKMKAARDRQTSLSSWEAFDAILKSVKWPTE